MDKPTTPTVLVIGVGSLDRGDDAAGRFAARRIKADHPNAPFTVIELRGEATELMDAWSQADTVLIIDAMSMGAAAGTVRRFDASSQPLPAEMACASTHDIGVCDAIELARAVGMLPRRVIVYGIEIEQLSHGSEPSPKVRAGIHEAATLIIDEAEQLTNRRTKHA